MMGPDPRDEAARKVLDLAKVDANSTISIFRVPWYWTVPVVKDTVLLYSPPVRVNELAFQTAYFETIKNPHIERAIDLPGSRFAVLSTLETSPFDRIENASQVPELWRKRYEELRPVLESTRANYDVVATYGEDAPVVEDLMYIQPKAYVLRHK
jgi:hypothetical protein